VLYPHRKKVDEENLRQYHRLPIADEEHEYNSSIETFDLTSGESVYNPQLVRLVRSGVQAPDTLTLKKFTQVMLLANLDVLHGLCNGTRGVVDGFDEEGFPVVKFITSLKGEYITVTVRPNEWKRCANDTAVCFRQIPLMLAWACTINKAQGATLTKVEVDLADCWSPGQIPVALSRATGFDALRVKSFNPSKIKVDPDVVALYASYDKAEQAEAGKRRRIE
jgi:hypothetical protein